MTSHRDHALDSLRGIAALAVVISHVISMTWNPLADAYAPTTMQRMLWDLGAPAVDLFLALSGYVLARSLLTRRQGYGGYVLSRCVRLLPIAWMGVLAGLALRAADVTLPIGASAGLAFLREPLATADVVGFATMLAPMADARKLDPPLWSLFIETQASLAMPLLAAAMERRPAAVAITCTAAALGAAIAFNVVYPLLLTGFVFGAALAATECRMPRAPRPALIAAAGAAMLLSRHVVGDAAIMRPICAAGATMMLLGVRQGAWRATLGRRVLHRLGGLSYPLYALHWPIMVAFAATLGHVIGITAAAAVSVPVSLGAAWFAERRVDRPATTLSHLVKSRAPR